MTVDMIRAQPFIFARIDIPLHFTRRVVILIDTLLTNQSAQGAQLIIAVHDLKILRQLRLLPVRTQQPMRNPVKSANPQTAGGNTQQLFDAPAHLPGGLVGKGHRKHAVGRDAFGLQQPGDAMHQHPGFAAAGAGQHLHMPGRGAHRLTLRVI